MQCHLCAYGVGPVDAALNAIQKITGETSKVLTKYGMDAISGGSGALCEVTVEVEDAHSQTISARHMRQGYCYNKRRGCP